jgi:hypothetical protein
MKSLPLSPLSLNQLTRDTWGQYDASAIALLAELATDPCYQPKFYKAPADDDEVMAANSYVAYGLKISPGSIIFGFYLPCIPTPGALESSVPGPYLVQITDVSMEHKWFDDPVASLFLSNYKPEVQNVIALQTSSFPNLLCAPYPVVGNGLFSVELWETSGAQQRVELVFGVLEVCPV